MSLSHNRYKVIKHLLDPKLTNFIYCYFLNKRRVAHFLFKHRYLSPFTMDFGVWNDPQTPNTYGHYSDIVMETVLQGLKPKIEKEVGYSLIESYTYARIYKAGDILHRHKDRSSCEVSATIHLGGQEWAIYLDPTGGKDRAGIKVVLKPGDAILYYGIELEHWRDPFHGTDCAQVFLHYSDARKKKGKNNKYDKRPFLGLPATFQNFKE